VSNVKNQAYALDSSGLKSFFLYLIELFCIIAGISFSTIMVCFFIFSGFIIVDMTRATPMLLSSMALLERF
jgi:hypothetical protein